MDVLFLGLLSESAIAALLKKYIENREIGYIIFLFSLAIIPKLIEKIFFHLHLIEYENMMPSCDDKD